MSTLVLANARTTQRSPAFQVAADFAGVSAQCSISVDPKKADGAANIATDQAHIAQIPIADIRRVGAQIQVVDPQTEMELSGQAVHVFESVSHDFTPQYDANISTIFHAGRPRCDLQHEIVDIDGLHMPEFSFRSRFDAVALLLVGRALYSLFVRLVPHP